MACRGVRASRGAYSLLVLCCGLPARAEVPRRLQTTGFLIEVPGPNNTKVTYFVPLPSKNASARVCPYDGTGTPPSSTANATAAAATGAFGPAGGNATGAGGDNVNRYCTNSSECVADPRCQFYTECGQGKCVEPTCPFDVYHLGVCSSSFQCANTSACATRGYTHCYTESCMAPASALAKCKSDCRKARGDAWSCDADAAAAAGGNTTYACTDVGASSAVPWALVWACVCVAIVYSVVFTWYCCCRGKDARVAPTDNAQPLHPFLQDEVLEDAPPPYVAVEGDVPPDGSDGGGGGETTPRPASRAPPDTAGAPPEWDLFMAQQTTLSGSPPPPAHYPAPSADAPASAASIPGGPETHGSTTSHNLQAEDMLSDGEHEPTLESSFVRDVADIARRMELCESQAAAALDGGDAEPGGEPGGEAGGELPVLRASDALIPSGRYRRTSLERKGYASSPPDSSAT